MLVTKQSETKWKDETYNVFFFINPFLFRNKWNLVWLKYIGKTLKQDVTDQTIWNMLVTKQSETKWNDETYNFFFYNILIVSFVTKQKWVDKKKKRWCFIVTFRYTHFCFVTNETIKIYRKNSETGCNSPKELFKARYETGLIKKKDVRFMKRNETMKHTIFFSFINPFLFRNKWND